MNDILTAFASGLVVTLTGILGDAEPMEEIEHFHTCTTSDCFIPLTFTVVLVLVTAVLS